MRTTFLRLRDIVVSVMAVSPLVACGTTTNESGPCKLESAGTPLACTGGTQPTWQASVSGDTSTCGLATDGGITYGTPCETFCGSGFSGSCTIAGKTVTCNEACAVPGRPHGALSRDDAPSADGIVGYFAQAAWFEAASADAFAILERDLREHGAPASLQRAARTARMDEVRHAEIAASIARSLGATTKRPNAPHASPRALEDIALENAVEGCVNETVSAALAIWQSERAAPELRAAFEEIARDEAEHAALAARVDAWIMPQLGDAARARVDAARTAKWEAMERSSATNDARLGLPTAIEQQTLVRALRRAA